MGELLLLLIAGHYLADFGLQNDFVAKMKGKAYIDPIGIHCLTAHGWIHGLTTAAVCLTLGYDWVVPFGIVTGSHILIDFGKSWEGWAEHTGKPAGQGLYGIHVDQALHGAMLVLAAVVTV
jgi:hypothetical protein